MSYSNVLSLEVVTRILRFCVGNVGLHQGELV
jgi:hypothetical protein